MTEPTIQQLTGEVDDLTRKVNDMANILALLQVNGLNDAFDGSGNQVFGGNRGRLNKNGVEVLVGTSVGTKYFYQYLETAFSTDPANTLPLLAHGAYISPTAIQDDFNAYLTAGNYGRLFVYADTTPAQRAGAEAARGATLAQGYANIGAADDGHFFVKPALYLDSLTADPTGVADGYLWYRSDTDKFYVRANGVTVQLTTGGGGMKVQGSGYKVMPAAAAGIDPAISGGAAWSDGAYSQVIASTAEADYILGVTWDFASGGASREAELDIATGGAGSETVVSTLSMNKSPDGFGAGAPQTSMLPFPIAVATSTRIAIRQRCSSTVDGVINIKLIYCKQSDLVSL